MEKRLDDTRVVETGLRRSPFFGTLSSMKFAVLVMSLIAVATLLAVLFPQGMDESFYESTLGDRLFHIYDSLGLLSVLRSWWFMQLFILLCLSLVLCSYSRIREGKYRATAGPRPYEIEFPVPKSPDDIMLIFPVLLSSIGFSKKRIVHYEKLTEIIAERGVPPRLSSVLLHLALALFLTGLTLSYLQSWGGSLYLMYGVPYTLPETRRETRWEALRRGVFPTAEVSDESRRPTMELLQFTKEYLPAPKGLDLPDEATVLPTRSIPRYQIVQEGSGGVRLLTDWQSWIRVSRGTESRVVSVSAGESVEALGLSMCQEYFKEVARLEVGAERDTVEVTLPGDVSIEELRLRVFKPPPAAGGGTAAGAPVLRIASPRLSGDAVDADTVGGRIVDVPVGQAIDLDGLPLRVLDVRDVIVIRVRSDSGRSLLRLGAFALVLFTMLRLYMYSYALRVEIRPMRGGSSRIFLRIRSSGLTSSAARVSRRVASLLAK